MEIQQLIRERVFNTPFELIDTDGNLYPIDLFREEYSKLRNYFLENVSTTSGVGIMLSKNPRYLMAMLASMDSGIPYVPMRDDYPESRVEQIKVETGFDLLLNESAFEEILKSNSLDFKSKQHTKLDTLYTICTSGSTGKPKAVVVSRTSIKDFWQWCDTYFSNISNTDKVLQVADFTFDISLIDVGLFLHKGSSLHFSKFKGNIFTLALEIESKQITFLNTVVNNFDMLLQESVRTRANYTSLKSTVMGGARFTSGLYNKCVNHFSTVEVNNLYGVTEVPVYSHAKKMSFDKTDLDNSNISVGSTLGSTVAVIVKAGKAVQKGEKGELLLGGGQLMKEYANNPEMTKDVLIQFEGQTYYKTGDISYQNESGEYFIVGRMDDTIKYRGYRINLLDIDSYIQKLSYVEHAVTFAIPNELTQNTTICYIKVKEDRKVKEIKKDLGNTLLEYQVPEKILLVDSFPLNDNGKICKKTLRSYHLEE